MGGVNASLLAMATAGGLAIAGWAAVHIVRAGFDYMSTRGNPRNRAQAHESMRDVVIGVLLAGGAIGIGAFVVANMKFG